MLGARAVSQRRSVDPNAMTYVGYLGGIAFGVLPFGVLPLP